MKKHPLGIQRDAAFWRKVGAYWTALIVGALILWGVSALGLQVWTDAPDWLKQRRSPLKVLLFYMVCFVATAFAIYGVRMIQKAWFVKPGNHLGLTPDVQSESVPDYPANLRGKPGEDGPRP